MAPLEGGPFGGCFRCVLSGTRNGEDPVVPRIVPRVGYRTPRAVGVVHHVDPIALGRPADVGNQPHANGPRKGLPAFGVRVRARNGNRQLGSLSREPVHTQEQEIELRTRSGGDGGDEHVDVAVVWIPHPVHEGDYAPHVVEVTCSPLAIQEDANPVRGWVRCRGPRGCLGVKGTERRKDRRQQEPHSDRSDPCEASAGGGPWVGYRHLSAELTASTLVRPPAPTCPGRSIRATSFSC